MKKVFVIDDDAMMRLMSKSTLEQAGFSVVELANAESAIDLLSTENPDAILLDVELPGMNGFVACETIRKIPHKEHLPIMMLTGLGDLDSINHAYNVGATDFVTKPMNWSTLAHRLLYIIRSNRALVDLNKSQQRLKNAKKIAQIADWECDPYLGCVSWSDELYALLGLLPEETVNHHEQILEFILEEDVAKVSNALHELFTNNKPYDLEYRIKPKRGALIHVHEKASVMLGHNDVVMSYMGTVQDVTKRKLIEAQVRQMAYYDSLTGLSNRLLFNEHLSAAIKRASRNQTPLAVLFIDLDNFKRVNDSLGHDAGDHLLQEVGKRLQNSLRESDVIARPGQEQTQPVARFGGDEFMVLLTDNVSVNVTSIIATRILSRLSLPILLGNDEVSVSGSLGIAFYPEDGQDGATLLKNADAAMYAAKTGGKNNFQFYHLMNRKAED